MGSSHMRGGDGHCCTPPSSDLAHWSLHDGSTQTCDGSLHAVDPFLPRPSITPPRQQQQQESTSPSPKGKRRRLSTGAAAGAGLSSSAPSIYRFAIHPWSSSTAEEEDEYHLLCDVVVELKIPLVFCSWQQSRHRMWCCLRDGSRPAEPYPTHLFLHPSQRSISAVILWAIAMGIAVVSTQYLYDSLTHLSHGEALPIQPEHCPALFADIPVSVLQPALLLRSRSATAGVTTSPSLAAQLRRGHMDELLPAGQVAERLHFSPLYLDMAVGLLQEEERNTEGEEREDDEMGAAATTASAPPSASTLTSCCYRDVVADLRLLLRELIHIEGGTTVSCHADDAISSASGRGSGGSRADIILAVQQHYPAALSVEASPSSGTMRRGGTSSTTPTREESDSVRLDAILQSLWLEGRELLQQEQALATACSIRGAPPPRVVKASWLVACLVLQAAVRQQSGVLLESARQVPLGQFGVIPLTAAPGEEEEAQLEEGQRDGILEVVPYHHQQLDQQQGMPGSADEGESEGNAMSALLTRLAAIVDGKVKVAPGPSCAVKDTTVMATAITMSAEGRSTSGSGGLLLASHSCSSVPASYPPSSSPLLLGCDPQPHHYDEVDPLSGSALSMLPPFSAPRTVPPLWHDEDEDDVEYRQSVDSS